MTGVGRRYNSTHPAACLLARDHADGMIAMLRISRGETGDVFPCHCDDPPGPLLTTEQAVRGSGLKAATIRAWASRGKLRNHGTRKQALWDLNQLVACSRRGSVTKP